MIGELRGEQHFNIDGQIIVLSFYITDARNDIEYKVRSETPMTPKQIAFILHLVSKKLCLDNDIDISTLLYELRPADGTH